MYTIHEIFCIINIKDAFQMILEEYSTNIKILKF